MLKLSPTAEPYWLDLIPGVRVRVRPISVADMLIAREAVSKVFRGEDQEDLSVRANIALVRELAMRGIMEWEGVGGEDDQPLPVSRDNVGKLLDFWPAYDEIDARYVGPALDRSAEKNGSSSLPDGTSGEGPDTAKPARSSARTART